MGKGNYIELWEKQLPQILQAIKNGNGAIQLSAEDFDSSGNRKSYSFRLDIVDASVPSKSGSAVARHLKAVLDDSAEFRKVAQGKNIVINMGRSFVLNINSTPHD